LNLGIFSKIRDLFSDSLSQILKQLVSFTKFSFDLRSFPLSNRWRSANRRFNSPYGLLFADSGSRRVGA
jgi:hypothetical protein